MHSAGSRPCGRPRRSAARRRMRRYALAQSRGRSAGISPMPRHLRGTTRNTSRTSCLGAPSCRRGARRGVLVLDLRAPLLELLHAHVDALQDVERLEAGDDDRHAILRGQRLVLRVAHDRADVTGGEKTLHAVVRRRRIASIAGGTSTCETSIEKFAHAARAPPDTPPSRWPARSSRSRRRRTRPARSGCRARDARRRRAASRRCARRRPRALTASRSLLRARHPQHVAEGAEDARRAATRSRCALSISSSGVTQTGQPGPWTSVTPGGSSSSTPNFTMAWVWPPQTSMSVHGRVVIGAALARIAGRRRRGRDTRRCTS